MSEGNGLPPGWALAKLEEATEVVMGQSPPSSAYNEEGEGLPFFQGKAEFTDLFPVARKWCSAPTKIAEPDDVLLSVRAPVGPTNVARSRCCIGRGLAAIRPLDGIESRYILYAMRALESNLSEHATGSTFEAVSGGVVRAFQIPVAPSEEQRRIVAAIEEQFARLDAGAAALERTKANLKRYRASVLKAAVEGRLTEDWREEHPDTEDASALLERILEERRARWEEAQLAKYQKSGKAPPKGWRSKYKEPDKPDAADLPMLPGRWHWATVEQIAEVIGGVTKGRNLAKRSTATLPYLRVANVQRGFLDLTVMKDIDIPEEEVERYLLHYGDIVLTEGGDADKLGRAALWRNEIEQCIHQNHIFRARLIDRMMLPQWIVFYANSEQGQYYFRRAAKQTVNLASINLTQLRTCPIPLPPLAEQEEIVGEVERRLSVVEEVEAQVEAGLKRAERLRQAILKRALEGRLVPQDPSDEPASVLLERIRQERAAQEKPRNKKASKKNSRRYSARVPRAHNADQPGLF